MNDVMLRKKTMAVVRDMDTEAIIKMLEAAPKSLVPYPAMDDLASFVQKEATREVRDHEVEAEAFFLERTPDFEITASEKLEPLDIPRSSNFVNANPLRQLERRYGPQKGHTLVPGEGPLPREKIDLSEFEKPDVDYIGKLYGSDGSGRDDHSDDEGFL